MPKVLGRYHIISELGRGGMGVVYKAVDPKLERFIAIKCLNEELSNDEITVTRFLREARNVAALNHPHIAQIFLADEDEGRPYFVMEYIDGESMAERLARDGRLMPEQARRLVIECAEALHAAHEENIVHRDIKPGNIMIDRRGRAVLTDFGIASIVRPDEQPTSSKFIMGTPGYLPPEVMTGRPADHRGDIFALGAVYYEMLAGQRLVPGRDIEDTARTLLAADFPELGDLDEQLDEASFGVLGRMLSPDPDKRYQDYATLLADLRVESVAVSATGKKPPPAATADDDPTRRATPPPAPVATAPAASTAPPATEAIEPSRAQPPTTQSAPPPAGRHRARNFGLLGVLVLSLVLVGLGVARVAPERFDQVAGLFGSERGTATDATLDRPDRQATQELASADRFDPAMDLALVESRDLREEGSGRTQASLETEEPGPAGPLIEPIPLQASISASAARLVADSAPTVEVAEEPASPETSQETNSPAVEPDGDGPETRSPDAGSVTGQPLQVAAVSSESAASAPGPAERADEATRPATTRTPRPEPARPTPSGVLVLGIGDPVLVDPMVREIEQALRADGRLIIERGYVPGLSDLTGATELDLAALAGAAAEAGARYAVVARAMPAGQRQLEYYGRTDTAFIVQIETITYDLSQRQRLGASDLEQIEYTALNATGQARSAIAPQLAMIRDALKP